MADPRRLSAAFVALAVVLGGAACGGVPDSSAVREGNPVPVAAAEDPLDIRLLVRAPAPGAAPAEIVRGFLTASASYENNHSVARTYLTAAAAASWDPLAQVVIYDDSAASPIRTPSSRKRVSVVPLRAPQLATIDRAGGYTVAQPATRFEADVRLVRERGEWRIANPPEGVVLTPLDVARSLQQLHVYFLDRSLEVVVPDNVFFPATTARSTALIRALLNGPTSWLAPAVRTAVPGGTTLNGTAAVDDDGTVTVDLSRQVLATTPSQRAQLSAQIVWTLRQLPEVSRVRILVEGSALDVPAVDEVQSRDAWPGFDPDALTAGVTAYYRNGDRWLSLDGPPLTGPLGRPGAGIRHLALSPGSDLAGGLRVNGGRTTVFAGAVTAGPEAVLTENGRFTPPSWDSADEMWIARRGAPTSVFVYRPGLPVAVVAAPALANRDVRQLRVSRDGGRVVVVVGRGSAGEVLVGRVRTAAGGLRLDGFRLLAPDITAVADVAWADASTVVVLGRSGSGRRQPWVIEADGSELNPLSTTGLTSYAAVAAAPGQPTVVESDGFVYVARRGVWSQVGRGSEPLYRG